MDPVKILGLSRPCTQEAAKSAYRKLALRYHPDKAGVAFTEKFTQIQAAYDLIQEKPQVLHRWTPEKFDDDSDDQEFAPPSAGECTRSDHRPYSDHRTSYPDESKYSSKPQKCHNTNAKSDKPTCKGAKPSTPKPPVSRSFTSNLPRRSEPKVETRNKPDHGTQHNSREEHVQRYKVSDHTVHRYSYRVIVEERPRTDQHIPSSRHSRQNHHEDSDHNRLKSSSSKHHRPEKPTATSTRPQDLSHSRSNFDASRLGNLIKIRARADAWYTDRDTAFKRSVTENPVRFYLDAATTKTSIHRSGASIFRLLIDISRRLAQVSHEQDLDDLTRDIGVLLHRLKRLTVAQLTYNARARENVDITRWRQMDIWDLAEEIQVQELLTRKKDKKLVEEGWVSV